ncbi:hypothetical protein [Blattabacterium cuenoti]|uniref:hypothetical protein n=1 Tax=Blattabacterium cuenoti TaxID=1653831 RepID=UPI00163C6A71|nr:hypothetical protein [Blattabacterium cuenoti]
MFQFSTKIKRNIFLIIIIGLILIFLDMILLNNKINKPWSSLYISIFYFTSISIGSMFFLAVQNVSKSGWSIIIYPIIEEIISFIPYGCLMILIILFLNGMGLLKMFQWMNDNLFNPMSKEYDEIIAHKKMFLNIPFFLIRSIIYIFGYIFFYLSIKKISSTFSIRRSSYSSLENYKKLNLISILFIIFFSIASMLMSWDWIMSLNPHWFSTLFGWYVLSSYLVTGLSVITIVSIYLKKKGNLPLFNENHLHDLSKYLFSGSLLWTYFWFSQFLLYWYGNIPEEILFFLKRKELYHNIHFWILIPNFLIPFFCLISSKIKTNPRIVSIVSIIICIGHFIDIYNLIAPDIGHKGEKFIFSDIGAFLLISGLFIYILLLNLSKRKLMLIGHPLFQESKNYKYPHIKNK